MSNQSKPQDQKFANTGTATPSQQRSGQPQDQKNKSSQPDRSQSSNKNEPNKSSY